MTNAKNADENTVKTTHTGPEASMTCLEKLNRARLLRVIVKTWHARTQSVIDDLMEHLTQVERKEAAIFFGDRINQLQMKGVYDV